MSKARVSGALKTITGGKVQIGGVLKAMTRLAYYDGAAVRDLQVFTSPLSASASPTVVAGTITRTGTSTSDATTVTPSGGRAPYSYSWAKVSGQGDILSPTSATTRFQTASGVFRCTVTDTLGATASADVEAYFVSHPPGSGGDGIEP